MALLNQITPAAVGSRQVAVIVLQVLFVSIALIVFILRIYTRAHILRSTGNDDYVMGAAVVRRISFVHSNFSIS